MDTQLAVQTFSHLPGRLAALPLGRVLFGFLLTELLVSFSFFLGFLRLFLGGF